MSKKSVLLLLAFLIGVGILYWFQFNRTEPPLHPAAIAQYPQKTIPIPAATTSPKPVVAFKNPLELDTTFEPDDNQDYASLSEMELWESLRAKLEQGSTNIALENALIARLRQTTNMDVYSQLVDVFRHGTFSPAAQQLLVSLLGEITTYDAGETLMRLLQERLISSPDVKLAAIGAINKFVPELWYEHSNAELSPLFESAWGKIDDPAFLSAIAQVMAKIGTPKSLAIFTRTLFENNDSARVGIVKEAMADFENPALIKQFSANLQSSRSKNVQWASGYALANMGQNTAALALFDWALRADDSQAKSTKEWFEIAVTTTPEFVNWLSLNMSTQSFNSLTIKQTVESVLEDLTL